MDVVMQIKLQTNPLFKVKVGSVVTTASIKIESGKNKGKDELRILIRSIRIRAGLNWVRTVPLLLLNMHFFSRKEY